MRTALLFVLLASVPVTAQISEASRSVGGLGAWGCQNDRNPPTLSDGTLATGTYDIAYDSSTGRLTLVVTNTSPVTPRVQNPLITDVYLNLPAGAITRARLVGQTAAGGAPPAFGLTHDADLHVRPDLNKANCFGLFSLHLAAGRGIHGGVANAAADRIGAPRGSWVVGPVRFEIQLEGPGVSGITAGAIARGFSQRAPYQSVNVALKFQAGQSGGSGVIANGPKCETAIYVVGEPRIGSTIDFCVSGGTGCHVCVWVSATPGPSEYDGRVVPIGLPLLASADLGPIVYANVMCFDFTIPDEPGLVGTSLYFTNVTHPPGQPDQISFAERFTLTILPRE